MKKIISDEKLQNAISYIGGKTLANLSDFTYKYPASASVNNIYPQTDNVSWTTSFYTGMLHLSYQKTKDERFEKAAAVHTKDFARRLKERIDLGNHDIGFLYTLSCVGAYKIKNDEFAKETAVKAADMLLDRYIEKAGVIHCWGDMEGCTEYARIIVDCLLNLPLLYWASEATGDDKYKRAAYTHAKNTQKYIIRPDKSTYHSYIFNVKTGLADHGETVQGFADNSCWSRGQAWGIYGFMLSYLYTGDKSFIETACELLDYFLSHLPEDHVPYWDLYFQSGNEERDSSAAAITACGIIEILKALDESDPRRDKYTQALSDILNSLIDNYMTTPDTASNGILLHGVYGKPQNNGIDECLIWGDYFFLEALMRLDNPKLEIMW